MARFVLGVSLILLLASVAIAQNPQKSDPQAVALATAAMTALLNGVRAVSDVTLSGNADWTSGPDSETGTVAAYGKTNVENQLDPALSTGKRGELRNSGKLDLKLSLRLSRRGFFPSDIVVFVCPRIALY